MEIRSVKLDATFFFQFVQLSDLFHSKMFFLCNIMKAEQDYSHAHGRIKEGSAPLDAAQSTYCIVFTYCIVLYCLDQYTYCALPFYSPIYLLCPFLHFGDIVMYSPWIRLWSFSGSVIQGVPYQI